MAPYSRDLRTRVLADRDAGVAAKDVAVKFRVSLSWVNRLVQRRRETGEVEPRPQTVFKKQAFAGQEDHLRALVDAQPDRTLSELREALHSTASLSSVWRALDRLRFTVKKNRTDADEQRRPDVAADRRQWREWQPLRDVRQYVFLDECGVTTDLLRPLWPKSARHAAPRSHAVQPLADPHRRRRAPPRRPGRARRVRRAHR